MKSAVNKKTLTGTVVSNKMDKTVVIKVVRRFAHPTFKKVVRTTNKYKVHDEKNECQPGDFISVCETRPLSKEKRWRLTAIIKKATFADQGKAK
ncbi:MAG: 30S ribosomal protein S17 [Nitrospinaceae bacterium]|nr:MAG: 30S ribosomal protein S17 [Nitrospinaceae bacterium]